MLIRTNVSTLVVGLCLLCLAGQAQAGGGTIVSAQDGDWATGTTWVGGVPPNGGGGESADVRHILSVTTAGTSASDIFLGRTTDATLNISAGNLAGGLFRIGQIGGVGNVNVSGGVVSGSVIVGELNAGAYTVSGGTVNAISMNVGTNVQAASLTIQGSGGSINLTSGAGTGLDVGADGTVVIVPTANGAAGLSTITVTNDVNLDAGSTLSLDISSYTPSVGDEWNLIAYSGLRTGIFGTLSAPAGYTLVEDDGTPGITTIRVSAIPGAAVPMLSPMWTATLVALLVVVGSLAVAQFRRRSPVMRAG